MKIQALLVLSASAMKHEKGRTDEFKIHIGGGAFDAGTSEALAKWAIRKCEKKVCAVWAWAKCPLDREFGKDSKLTQAPCCHKCWNKCPPYLARHKAKDRSSFANNEKRRAIKDQIWKFLEDDIQCETTKLKQQFMNPEEHGLSFAHIAGDLMDDDCEEGDEECENEFSKYNMANDMMNDPDNSGQIAPNYRVHPVRDPSCDDKHGWFKCHGFAKSKCCSKGCLNQAEGEDKPLCDQCNCNGRCDYLHDAVFAFEKNSQLRCDLEPAPKAGDRVEGVEAIESEEEDEREPEYEEEEE
jgi:hypothetical protein